MGLECLLLTRDSALLGRIRAKFSELGIEILVRKDATLAVELSKRRHLDGFVIDCDEVPAGKEALSNIRGNPANKRSVMVAVVSGATSVSEAIERGANFVLNKPLQDGRLCACLDMAVAKMEREHRRYFRHAIDLPVEFQLHTGQSFLAKMLNVSEGGFAIQISKPLPEAVLSVQFDLPSIESENFRGRAVVVWASDSVTGLRFLYIEPQCRAGFEAWLESLEGQLRFRESVQASRM
jgi:ActR/RegA family two-component response regulator